MILATLRLLVVVLILRNHSLTDKNANGDEEKIDPFFCRIAELRRELVNREKAILLAQRQSK